MPVNPIPMDHCIKLSLFSMASNRVFISRLHKQGQDLSKAQRDALTEELEEIRERLYSLSWYMRCLNEYVARLANKEEGVKDRFWEGRYKSQALLDEKALLAALAYVDLNPVRAGMARVPEDAQFTSIYERIMAMKGEGEQDERLMQFKGEGNGQVRAREEDGKGCDGGGTFSDADSGKDTVVIPFEFKDYLELVDWTGKYIRKDGRGAVDESAPAILQRLGIEPKGFLALSRSFLREFGHAVGDRKRLLLRKSYLGVRHLKGLRAAQALG